ncbi:hypothetical protein ACQP3L_37425, partial [Escherichia coli]
MPQCLLGRVVPRAPAAAPYGSALRERKRACDVTSGVRLGFLRCFLPRFLFAARPPPSWVACTLPGEPAAPSRVVGL